MMVFNRENFTKRIVADPFFGGAVQFLSNRLGDLGGKVMLDSGCGEGKMSVFFALQGAKVIGIDKSHEQICEAIRLADSCGVANNCKFLVGTSEQMPFNSDSIDLVFSRSAIQYMERDKVLGEYVRIVKPGGDVALVENLPYNPFIVGYRVCRKMLAKTAQESEYVESIKGYIKFNEIERLKSKFSLTDSSSHHLFRMVSLYLVWRFPFSAFAQWLDCFLSVMDDFIFRMLPPSRRFAWYVAVYFKKKIGDR